MFWLLKQKDAARQKDIEMLWEEHRSDVKRLQDLELDIAKKHYERSELDVRFDRIERMVQESFNRLGEKIDRLVEERRS